MARIVVLGAGIGGLSVAMELKQLLNENQEVIVISEMPTMNFNPVNHWVAVNVTNPQDIGVELALLLTQHGIGFIQRSAKKVHPEKNQVELDGDVLVDYDFLIIATGPKPAFDEIPGFGPEAFTRSVCRVGEAIETGKAWENFVRDPGSIVVGAVQGASNFAAAYEYTMVVDNDLRNRGLRQQIPMTFVSAEPYIGHLGVGGNNQTRETLENEFRDHDIQWIVNAKVERIEPNQIHITEFDESGAEKQQHSLPFKHCMMMPAYVGVDAVRGIKDLVTERGFVIVDKCQRNPRFMNIYGVGVCVDVPIKEQTPVPVGAQKNGYMIETMVTVVAHNISGQLNGLEPSEEACLEFYPKEIAPPVYTGDGRFDKKWVNPVSGLYAFALWNQIVTANPVD